MNSFRLTLIAFFLLFFLGGCVSSPRPSLVTHQQVYQNGGPEGKILAMAVTFGLPITFCLDCVIVLVTVWDDELPEPFFMTRELMEIIRELMKG